MLTEHQVLVLFAQLLALFVAARLLGGLMRRMHQPAVIGELAAGLLLGPSILGRALPEVSAWLFPVGDPVQSAALAAIAWLGVTLLLIVTGFETDLALLRRLGRSSALVSVGSLAVPLIAAFALGLALPDDFIGREVSRSTFALFVAVSLSISALAVIGKILVDMNLMRRNIGQVSLAAAMANDLVGWILLGTFAGIVHDGGFRVTGLLLTVGAIAAYLTFALTVGQRIADAALRRVRQRDGGAVGGITVNLGLALASGVITQMIGVEAVLGAFIAGIVLARSRYQTAETRHSIETLTASFFAPIFFASAGLRVDLGLLRGEAAVWTVVAVLVAFAAKGIGAYAGAATGGMQRREGLSVALLLNARGTLEIVVATVALGLGVFTNVSYTMVIILAMTTSLLAPPMLRRVLSSITAGPEEAARLEREAVMESSVVANTKTALLPTRGGSNSVLAGRLLDLSLQEGTGVTVLTVHGENEANATGRADAAAAEVGAHFTQRQTERLDVVSDNPAEAICSEARLGYGLVALGMTEGYSGGHTMSPVVQHVLSQCDVPILLVKGGAQLDPYADELAVRRILVPAIGTRVGQAAQEIAYTLAGRVDAEVGVVHVVSRPDRVPEPAMTTPRGPEPVSGMLDEAQALARKFGREVMPMTRNGPSVGMELAITAEEADADLLVLGAKVRSYSGQPFLGHGIEYLLEHATQTVMVVLFPAQLAETEPAP